MSFSPKTRGRCWIVTVQEKNMINAGLSKEQYFDYEFVADYFIGLWENSGDNRKAGLVVCKSALGLYHLHMACYGNTTTLKSVSDILYHSHVEPQYGGKDALKSYLLKEEIYSEKGEIVLLQKNLDALEDAQGKRSDLEEIARLLKEGQTPQQILRSNLQYYRYEKLILHAYTDMRIDTAPVKLDVYCEWHLGESGSGKTYYYNTLCDKHGKDKIYIVTDYDNNASGGFDGYMRIGCPPILFMDEFKGCGISYQKLLTILTGYTRMQTHSRFNNTYNLWDTVIITSVYPPEEIYEIMVDSEYRNTDSYKQLIRRISKIIYHYKENGEYKIFSVDGQNYVDYQTLKDMASGKCSIDGFKTLSEEEQLKLPFA